MDNQPLWVPRKERTTELIGLDDVTAFVTTGAVFAGDVVDRANWHVFFSPDSNTAPIWHRGCCDTVEEAHETVMQRLHDYGMIHTPLM